MRAEPRSAGGTVHWVGTGLSTGGTGLRAVCDRAARVVVWDRAVARGRRRLAALGLEDRAEVRALDEGVPESAVAPGDVVVSMLPATEHPALLRLALARRAHFACTSYASAELVEEAARAKEEGLVVLTEAGLDPGVDHLMAHRLVEEARAAVGDGPGLTATFTSYCGGLPAVPNDFRYRFSWAPYGVLAALGTPARYIEDGVSRTAARPWEAVRPLVLDGERFEVYPNRDSLPFVAQYGFPAGWRVSSFVRGTLRNEGWRAAWREVFATVRTGDEERIRALAAELAGRHPTTEGDRDRVVLTVALTLRDVGGAVVSEGSGLLDVTGDASESAMARCVSLPLAYGVRRVLDGALPSGLHRAAPDAVEAARWLDFLDGHGLRVTSPEPNRPA
ncbi:saccharopine dehydrogenase C-terminal domain-containing protein [Streptomyces sp. HSG2]|uniref:saccharopine dehydrogenase C-terminal domain-containing protein n=1 Tax=Streptomyces sp. HSG2 TaxID=2797167 RepID=UPI001902F5B1|nr:saccharopine dehydrogenase C-terminal domain-containing protein [Streptomyces sp. HSG2]